jgi:hypothetical protein
MRRIGLVGAVAVAVSIGPTHGAELWNHKIGGWHAGAYSRDGGFSHCAATVPYRSGIYLLFSVNSKTQWSMGLINPNWNLSIGSKYPISYRVDDGVTEYGTAVAISKGMVEIPLKNSIDLFNQFRAGQLLNVEAQRGTFGFRLTNSSQTLAFLLQCARDRGNKPQIAATDANPFTAAIPAKPAGKSDRTAERSEAMLFAANLVSALGITGFTFLKPSEIPSEMAADAAWKAPGRLGGVVVLPTTKDASTISSGIISFDAKGCKAKFASASLPSDEKDSFARLSTQCGTGNDGLVAYYVIVRRPAGGYYVISSYSRDNVEDAKSADSDIRSAVFKAMPR